MPHELPGETGSTVAGMNAGDANALREAQAAEADLAPTPNPNEEL